MGKSGVDRLVKVWDAVRYMGMQASVYLTLFVVWVAALLYGWVMYKFFVLIADHMGIG